MATKFEVQLKTKINESSIMERFGTPTSKAYKNCNIETTTITAGSCRGELSDSSNKFKSKIIFEYYFDDSTLVVASSISSDTLKISETDWEFEVSVPGGVEGLEKVIKGPSVKGKIQKMLEKNSENLHEKLKVIENDTAEIDSVLKEINSI